MGNGEEFWWKTEKEKPRLAFLIGAKILYKPSFKGGGNKNSPKKIQEDGGSQGDEIRRIALSELYKPNFIRGGRDI